MAIVFDERARRLIERRRAAGKDDRIYVRLERGSLRAYVPWIVRAGWMPRRLDPAGLIGHAGAVEVYMDARIARYTEEHDLILSAARLARWQWLMVADPFAYEELHAWEAAQRKSRPKATAAGMAMPAGETPATRRGTVTHIHAARRA